LTLAQKRSLGAIARDYTADAVGTLVAIMSDPKTPAAARVTAAVAVLDRGHGRPIPMAPEPPSPPPYDLSLLTGEELRTVAAALTIMERARARCPDNGAILALPGSPRS
jgi:hypothetical protein